MGAHQPSSADAAQTAQYVRFKLGQESYAFEVGSVREVVDYGAITRIPNTPSWACGVIEVRDAMVPVLDLKQKLGFARTDPTRSTRILILDVSPSATVGAVVDSVQTVFEISKDRLEPPPRVGERNSMDFVAAIGRLADDLVTILATADVFPGTTFLVDETRGAGE